MLPAKRRDLSQEFDRGPTTRSPSTTRHIPPSRREGRRPAMPSDRSTTALPLALGPDDGRTGSGPTGGLCLGVGGGPRPRRPRRPRRQQHVRAVEGRGGRVDVGRQTSRPGRERRCRGACSRGEESPRRPRGPRRPGRVPLRSRSGPLPRRTPADRGQPAVGVEVGTKRRRGAQAVTPPRSSCARP